MNVKNILLWLFTAVIVGVAGFFFAGLVFKKASVTPPAVEIIKESKFSVSGKLLTVSENSLSVESDRGTESFSLDLSSVITGPSGEPANKSYLVPGVLVSASIRDGRATGVKISALPEIIISSPAALSPVGLDFKASGFYKTSAEELTVRLVNGRTNTAYFEQKLSPKNKTSFYESFSLEISLKTAFDVLDGDNLTLYVSSVSGKEERSFTFGAGLTAKVKVPFLKGAACASVIETDRLTSAARSSVRSAFEEMIAGPTKSESASGFRSAFPDGTKIRLLRFENTAVSVDFSRELLPASGNPCSSAGLKAQLLAVLKQFPTVVSYEFRIDGKDWYKSQ